MKRELSSVTPVNLNPKQKRAVTAISVLGGKKQRYQNTRQYWFWLITFIHSMPKKGA
jgi:hypothetical protein